MTYLFIKKSELSLILSVATSIHFLFENQNLSITEFVYKRGFFGIGIYLCLFFVHVFIYLRKVFECTYVSQNYKDIYNVPFIPITIIHVFYGSNKATKYNFLL